MAKEQANFRIDTDAKQKAYVVLDKIGIKPTDAVNMFINYIAMYGKLPFNPSVPNAETLQTFSDTDSGKNLTKHESVESIFKKFN